ncbi:MAG: hypothetical protein KW806_00830 [Candidatus Yanofskybacteria bacterium]|nr:hypothetical protein [Candidatus Yanofskybacteria bacterium]
MEIRDYDLPDFGSSLQAERFDAEKQVIQYSVLGVRFNVRRYANGTRYWVCWRSKDCTDFSSEQFDYIKEQARRDFAAIDKDKSHLEAARLLIKARPRGPRKKPVDPRQQNLF